MLGETKVLFNYIHFLKNAQELFLELPQIRNSQSVYLMRFAHQLEEAFE